MFAPDLSCALKRNEDCLTRSQLNFTSTKAEDLTIPTSPSELMGINCPSPIKLDDAYCPSTSIMKLEPLSPQGSFPMTATEYSGKSHYGRQGLDWRTGSPDDNSFESLSPYSPVSAGGALPSVASPITSPLSNCSANTLSPSARNARDDLSPASSNGYGGEPPEKRKKSAHRQSEELCLVCGDRSSGYHYNALTCEGCKGFFRRSITKNAVYVCKYGQNCEMDMYMRRKCQECRFKKCISVGMRPDCVTQTLDSITPAGVVPEQQCKQKRDQKKSRDKPKDTPTPRSLPSYGLPIIPPPPMKIKGLPMLTKEHHELINRLVYNQERFENPSPQLVKECEEKLKEVYKNSGPSERYQQIMEMTRLTVELIVEFARNAPGFDSLKKEDQVTLLKASTSEIIALRASRKYHLETDSIVFADNSPVTKETYSSVNMEAAWTEAVFSFCRNMAKMMVDNAEYALLTGMAIFSDRPNVIEVKTVEKIQFLYAETLSSYVYNKGYQQPAAVYGKLLNVLVELRSFGVLNNEQCEKFINKDQDMPELLSEIWDIKR